MTRLAILTLALAFVAGPVLAGQKNELGVPGTQGQIIHFDPRNGTVLDCKALRV